jgi:hypothetical protein
MVSSYAFNSFTKDVYDEAQYTFMQSHMAGWIALAVNNNQ